MALVHEMYACRPANRRTQHGEEDHHHPAVPRDMQSGPQQPPHLPQEEAPPARDQAAAELLDMENACKGRLNQNSKGADAVNTHAM